MIETWVNNWGFAQTAHFHKTNLTFREAAYETIKDIRTRTNKNLVVPVSGGCESILIYKLFKELGIEIKTIHQRYWDGDRLINEYESKHVDLDKMDIIQDVDCTAEGEFRTSQWLKDIQAYCPIPYIGTVQNWIRHLLDPDHDFIIIGGQPGIAGWNYELNQIKYQTPGNILYWYQGLRDFENATLIGDNGTINYTTFDQTARNIMKNMSGDVEFEPEYKKILYEHHFPEFDHLYKSPQNEWWWPEDWWSLRKEYGENRGYIPHHTGWFPIERLDLFFDCIDNNVPIAGEWYEWDWSQLSDYGKEKFQYKIFTDKIEYFSTSRPHSENL